MNSKNLSSLKKQPSKRLILLLIGIFLALTLAITVRKLTVQAEWQSVKILTSIWRGYNTLVIFEYPNTVRFLDIRPQLDQAHYNGEIYLDPEYLMTFIDQVPALDIWRGRSIIVAREWRIELSSIDQEELHQLASNVVRHRGDGEFLVFQATGNIPYVWSTINGGWYWTIYTPNNFQILDTRSERRHFTNSHLTALVHKLVELSPYPVQGLQLPE